ncbi:MAG: hypothetical protein IPK55_11695 [Streptococcus sp.]|nr:hypothetical protein [Streptococcus sp.]
MGNLTIIPYSLNASSSPTTPFLRVVSSDPIPYLSTRLIIPVTQAKTALASLASKYLSLVNNLNYVFVVISSNFHISGFEVVPGISTSRTSTYLFYFIDLLTLNIRISDISLLRTILYSLAYSTTLSMEYLIR